MIEELAHPERISVELLNLQDEILGNLQLTRDQTIDMVKKLIDRFDIQRKELK